MNQFPEQVSSEFTDTTFRGIVAAEGKIPDGSPCLSSLPPQVPKTRRIAVRSSFSTGSVKP